LTYMDWIKRYADKYYPNVGIIRGVNEAEVRENKKKAKAKKIYFQKLMYKKLAEIVETWRHGFELFHKETGRAYWVRVIVLCCVFDLPAMSEATGMVLQAFRFAWLH
jgi:hypothetical protein